MSAHVTATLFLPDENVATFRTRINRQPKGVAMHELVKYFDSASLGARRGFARVQIGTVVASQTVTCDQSQAVDNTDTLVIAGTTLSEKAAPANESQYAKGASSTALMNNLVACINAHSVLSKIVYAVATTAASFRFTIYCVIPGPIGNLVTLSETGNSLTLGGATLANGACDAIKTYQLGYSTSAHLAG